MPGSLSRRLRRLPHISRGVVGPDRRSPRPHWFVPLVSVMLSAEFLSGLLETFLMGGLLESGLAIVFGRLVPIGGFIAIGLWAAV